MNIDDNQEGDMDSLLKLSKRVPLSPEIRDGNGIDHLVRLEVIIVISFKTTNNFFLARTKDT